MEIEQDEGIRVEIERRADEYEERLKNAGATDDLMGALADSVRRTQQNTRLTILSIALLFALFLAVVGLAAWVQSSNSNQIKQAQDYSAAQCEANNEVRKGQRELVTFIVFSLSVDSGITPAERAQARVLEGHVADTFADRDCEAARHGKVIERKP